MKPLSSGTTKKGKLVGAIYDKSRNKWISRANINGKSKFFGYFDSEKDANIKYIEMTRDLE